MQLTQDLTDSTSLPIIVLGQFFCLVHSCLGPRREELGSSDNIQPDPILIEDTSINTRF